MSSTTPTQEKLAQEEGDPAPDEEAPPTSTQDLPPGYSHTYIGNYPADVNPADARYNHFGDLDYHAGFLFIPFTGEGENRPLYPVIAVLRARDLSLVDYQTMYGMRGAGWPKDRAIVLKDTTGIPA